MLVWGVVQIDLSQVLDLGSDTFWMFVHVQVLLEAERGRWRTETRFRRNWGFEIKFREELRSYRSRMSCGTFRLESNVREDDHSLRHTWKMCRLRCGVCLSRCGWDEIGQTTTASILTEGRVVRRWKYRISRRRGVDQASRARLPVRASVWTMEFRF
jgi:hypothetical protein